jgi:hypothetical protein
VLDALGDDLDELLEYLDAWSEAGLTIDTPAELFEKEGLTPPTYET